MLTQDSRNAPLDLSASRLIFEPARGSREDCYFRTLAIRKPVAEFHINNVYSVLRLPDSYILLINVPSTFFRAIVDKIPPAARPADDVGSVELSQIIQRECPPGYLRLNRDDWRSLNKIEWLGEAERDSIKTLFQFLGTTRTPRIGATTIAVRVVNQDSHQIIQSVVRDSRSRVLTEATFHKAKMLGALPEHSAIWVSALDEAEQAFSRYQAVFRLHAAGIGIESIGKITNVTRGAIKNWLGGGMPAQIERIKRLSEKITNNAEFSTPRAMSEAWSTLLGAYQGSSTRGCAESNLVLHFDDKRSAEQVVDILSRLKFKTQVNLSPGNSQRDAWYNVPIYSRSVRLALLKCTSDNNAVPWEYLGSDLEKIAYLRAIFVNTGTMHRKRFCVSSKNHPDLIVSLATVLDQLGIPIDVHESSGLTYLKVSGVFALFQMRKLDLIPRRHIQAVDTILAGAKPGPHPCEKYDALMELKRKQPEIYVRDAAAQVGISNGTAEKWFLRRGVKPLAVTAREKLNRLQQDRGIPNRDVVPYLCRIANFSVDDARIVGRAFKLEQVEEALKRVARGGLNLRQVPLGVLQGALRENRGEKH